MFEGRFGYDETLPSEIREIFMWLSQDVASLQGKWDLYLGLFSEEEDTRLLSNLARASFHIIEESLRNDLTMSICRLSDPSKSHGQNNLSMATLVAYCTNVPNIDAILKEFKNACEPVRKYRNKRVGHNDLNTTIKPQAHPLPGIGRSHINKIIYLAGRLLNTIYHNFVDAELIFQPIQIGGAEDLLYLLRAGQEGQRNGTRVPE